ncbi:protein terminal ear1-like [Wolffia australiana]
MAANSLDPAAREFSPAPSSRSPLPTPPPPPPLFYAVAATPAAPVAAFFPDPRLNPNPYVSPAAALPDTKPTRALLLSSVPPHAGEFAVRAELEHFGGVRALEMGRALTEGLVTVQFYDLRCAQAALAEIRKQHVRQQSLLGQRYGLLGMGPSGTANWGNEEFSRRGLIAGQAVWAQFAPEPPALDGPNNGSLVVFNLDLGVSSAALKDVFEAFGAVKELRETPSKPRHRFVEFFDIRDAARALRELNGKEIFGKRVVIEFSRPGGQQARKKGAGHQPTPLPPRLLGQDQGDSIEKGESSRRSKRTSGGALPAAPATAARQHVGRHKGWKSHSGKGKSANETKFLFNELSLSGGAPSSSSPGDSRTTVMIKNIPNKYSQKLLLNMLDNHCIHCNERIVAEGDGSEAMSAYDFVYLPIDFNNKCNVGYGFVNMTSPEATWRLYRAFHSQPWEVFNSRKICHVTYARLQGIEALKEHFRNSKFACDTDEYMPVVFSPPRDGRVLTAPAPIGSRGGGTPSENENLQEEEEEKEEENDEDDDDSAEEKESEN